MAIRSKEYLKSRFETGDEPTNQDFIDLIDSFLAANFEDWPSTLPASSGANLTDIQQQLILNEFIEVGMQPGYIAPNQLAYVGDWTATFRPGRRLRLILDGGDVYTEVLTVHYDGPNNISTITLLDSVANNTISKVWVGLFKPVADGGAIGFGLLGVSAFMRPFLDAADNNAIYDLLELGEMALLDIDDMGELAFMDNDESIQWGAAQRSEIVNLTYASTVTPNALAGHYFKLVLAGNPIIANFNNKPAAGISQPGEFEIVQNGTGGFEPIWDSDYVGDDGDPPEPPMQDANAVTRYSYTIDSTGIVTVNKFAEYVP